MPFCEKFSCAAENLLVPFRNFLRSVKVYPLIYSFILAVIRNLANETAFKGLQIFPQTLAKQQRRQMRGNGESK